MYEVIDEGQFFFSFSPINVLEVETSRESFELHEETGGGEREKGKKNVMIYDNAIFVFFSYNFERRSTASSMTSRVAAYIRERTSIS